VLWEFSYTLDKWIWHLTFWLWSNSLCSCFGGLFLLRLTNVNCEQCEYNEWPYILTVYNRAKVSPWQEKTTLTRQLSKSTWWCPCNASREMQSVSASRNFSKRSHWTRVTGKLSARDTCCHIHFTKLPFHSYPFTSSSQQHISFVMLWQISYSSYVYLFWYQFMTCWWLQWRFDIFFERRKKFTRHICYIYCFLISAETCCTVSR
jgi:hypothetical protein